MKSTRLRSNWWMGGCLAWGRGEIGEVQIVENEQIGVHLVIGACLCSNVFEFKCWGNVLSHICVVLVL